MFDVNVDILKWLFLVFLARETTNSRGKRSASALQNTFDYYLNEKVKEDVADTDIWYNYLKMNIEGPVTEKTCHQWCSSKALGGKSKKNPTKYFLFPNTYSLGLQITF